LNYESLFGISTNRLHCPFSGILWFFIMESYRNKLSTLTGSWPWAKWQLKIGIFISVFKCKNLKKLVNFERYGWNFWVVCILVLLKQFRCPFVNKNQSNLNRKNVHHFHTLEIIVLLQKKWIFLIFLKVNRNFFHVIDFL
jgi:hypothetical protein